MVVSREVAFPGLGHEAVVDDLLVTQGRGRVPQLEARPFPLPEPEHRLLVHSQDMTSTLASFHESPLRVEILQHQRENELYLREVFLRTIRSDTIVEYGVIAIALDQFTAPQQAAVEGGQIPLGGLLHRFKIPFESAPIGFFRASSASFTVSKKLLQ